MPEYHFSDYEPGCLSTLCAMQAAYYAREWQLGHLYESVVAQGVSEFLSRLHNPENPHFVRIVKLRIAKQGAVVKGGIVIDNKDGKLGQLRWFIVDHSLRGTGIGKSLICSAMDFVESGSLQKVFLTTIAGLDKARSLYELMGFTLVEEKVATTWGRELTEQRLEWQRGKA